MKSPPPQGHSPVLYRTRIPSAPPPPRRGLALAALLAAVCMAAGPMPAAAAEAPAPFSTSMPAPNAASAGAAKMASGVIRWDDLAPKQTKTGFRRDVFDLPTPTLDRFHCHITTLDPGQTTGAPHRHPQEEFIVLKEGTLEVNIDGRKQTATAGSMIFFAANEMENMRNIGAAPATYYVIQFFTTLTPKG